MLELRDIASVSSGVAFREAAEGDSRLARLSDISHMQAGRSPSLVAGFAPAVARAQTIEAGDLVVGARGNSTEVCLARDQLLGAYVSLDLYLVRPDVSRVNPRYLATFLALSASQARLASGRQGTGLVRLAKDALETIEIPLPPLSQQAAIATLAEAFDETAAALRRLTELNEQFARAALARVIADSRAKRPLE